MYIKYYMINEQPCCRDLLKPRSLQSNSEAQYGALKGRTLLLPLLLSFFKNSPLGGALTTRCTSASSCAFDACSGSGCRPGPSCIAWSPFRSLTAPCIPSTSLSPPQPGCFAAHQRPSTYTPRLWSHSLKISNTLAEGMRRRRLFHSSRALSR